MKVWLSVINQGFVFAVNLWHGTGTVVEYTKLAGQALAGLPTDGTVRMVNAALLGLPCDGKEPADEILRRQVQVQLALRKELAI